MLFLAYWLSWYGELINITVYLFFCLSVLHHCLCISMFGKFVTFLVVSSGTHSPKRSICQSICTNLGLVFFFINFSHTWRNNTMKNNTILLWAYWSWTGVSVSCHLALLNKERASCHSKWADVCVIIFFKKRKNYIYIYIYI